MASVLSGIIPPRIYFSYGLYPTGRYFLVACPFFPLHMSLIQSAFSLWIVVPTIIVAQLGKDLVESLNFAAEQSKKLKKN